MMNAQERGRWAEDIVARKLAREGWRILAARRKTPFAEIDLFVRRGTEDAVVEVKTAPHGDFGSSRLSARQMARLLRAREFCQDKTGRSTRLLLAWVGPGAEIQLFNLPEGCIE